MVLAPTGLIASLIVHMAALLGMPSPLGEKSWVLHIGIFVVWLPAVLVLQSLSGEFKQKDLWSFRNLHGSQEIRVIREAACAGRSWEWAACSAAG